MSGIAGIIGPSMAQARASMVVHQMLDRMEHRGPDGREVVSTSWSTIGAVQLEVMGRAEVLAEESRRRPKSVLAQTVTGGTILGLNGQVYNHDELGLDVGRPRAHGGASVDTQRVLSHYDAQGIAGLVDLRGEFSIAISDDRSRTVHLVRDPFGTRPLYWARSHGGIAFASEANALLALTDVSSTWDALSLAKFLAVRAVPGDRTIYSDIHLVRAGAATSITSDGARTVTPLWNLATEMRKRTSADLSAAISAAIEARCSRDVPMGLFLSGGVDSGTIARVAARGGHQLQTFTAVFPDVEGYSEGSKARRTADEVGSVHHDVQISQATYFSHLVSSSRALDQPCADPAIPIISHLCEAAADSVLVVLSGDGADEILSGYPIYADLEPQRDSYWGFGRLVTDAMRSEFLPTLDHLVDGGLQPFVDERWRTLADNLNQRQRFCLVDSDAWLARCLLTRLDNLTMRTGIEGRVPYLDWDVASAAAQALNEDDVGDKSVLRTLIRSLGGGGSADEPKRGLAVPTSRWLEANQQDVISIVMEGPIVDVIPSKELRRFLNHLFASGGNYEAQILHAFVVLALFGSTQ
jgi:asparagine synthase (glutamine-hydrolysing)